GAATAPPGPYRVAINASAWSSCVSAKQVASDAPVPSPLQSPPNTSAPTIASGHDAGTLRAIFVRPWAIFWAVVGSRLQSVAGGSCPALTLSWHFSSALATLLKSPRPAAAAFF